MIDKKDAAKLCWSQQGAGESYPAGHGKHASPILLWSFLHWQYREMHLACWTQTHIICLKPWSGFILSL